MSLREAIKDLKNVAKTLDRTNFNFEMNALEKFLAGIKVDKPAKPPENVLEKLLWKFRNRVEDFSSREIRALPFIIYEPEIVSYEMIAILQLMDFSRTSHLRGVLSVYLEHHDDSNKTERLRRELNNVRNVDSALLRKVFAARQYLFSNERFQNMAKLFAEKRSVAGALEEFGLSNFYKASKFIQTALKIFFRANVPPAAQFKILDELDSEFDTYKNIFPAVADALIQTVVRTGYGKNKCMEIFYRRLGDPRFGNSRFNWNGVSQKSRDIFCHWLSEEDLEIFFELINQTAVNRMWRYREKFWRAYLPYIVKTKIFLGNNAKMLAAQIKNKIELKHGNLTGSSDDQSAFVFQIGQYIFSEWSYNGKLRVHKIDTTFNLFDTAEDFFEKNSISRNVLEKNSVDEWIHYNAEKYFWQNKVGAWLGENCGIYKTENDWGLEN